VFGTPIRDVKYVDRLGAYAIIVVSNNRLAFVQGQGGRLYLPGGGIEHGEQPEAALLREIAEETGWSARILGILGHATQLLFAQGEGHYAVRATYFRAQLVQPDTTRRASDIIWFSATAAIPLLARESDVWAISRAVNSN
jgi:8-oxo-dGTP diphosphatase